MSAETKLSALVDGALRAHCLRAIYDLKVNDILNKNGGFMSTGEIISEMEGKCVNPDVLGRLMRYMARFDLFDEKYEGSKFYFKTTEMLQFQESIELIDRIEVSFKIMDLLTDNTDGKTLYEHTKGIKFWDYLLDNNNKRYKANFQALMLSISNRIIPFVPQITEEIKLQGKENSVIVDVGGLSGQMLQLFHKQLPDLKCINLDLPHVIEKVKPIENIKMVGGDMFKVDTLPQCGVIFTKHILHNWSDEKCVEILKNFHTALDEDGIVFNVSFHLAEPGESNDEWENFAMDMTMLYQFGEAKERTVTEYRDMHNKAGFEVIKAVKLGPTEKPHILIIASKK